MAELAIFGGRRAVTVKGRDRWRKVGLRDLAKIGLLGLLDYNTWVAGGPIAWFERDFCRMAQTTYGILMNSGTSALHSAYLALGVGPGDEVIVPAYTFFASAAPVLMCGATPVFCDIDPDTLTADVNHVESLITPRTKAICVVHVWGFPAAMDTLVALAKRHSVALVEDCSHAHGARYRGRSVGSWGDVGCFSLQGNKAVSGGELGIAVTNDPEIHDRILRVGHYGRILKTAASDIHDAEELSLGVKYRPHLYGVMLASGSLRRLPRLNQLRKRNDAILAETLGDCSAVQPIQLLPEAERGGYLEFILRYRPEHAGGWPRGAFVNACRAEGVPISADRYTLIGRSLSMLHRTTTFTNVDLSKFGGDLPDAAEHQRQRGAAKLPNCDLLSEQLITLPPLTRVKARYVQQVGQAIRKVAEAAARITDFKRGV
jgi:dTDP-4-amino-4,6-dideoxygalactose transaminase